MKISDIQFIILFDIVYIYTPDKSAPATPTISTAVQALPRVSTEHAPLNQDHATVDVEPHTPTSSEIEESADHDHFCNPLGSESMSLDDTDTIEDESGSESSWSGRSECNLCSTIAPPPTPAGLLSVPAIPTTIEQLKEHQDQEHADLHWTACYETGCRHHRDEDKAYQLCQPRPTTCLYCDETGHKEFQCPDNEKSDLFQRRVPDPPIAPATICQYCRKPEHTTDKCKLKKLNFYKHLMATAKQISRLVPDPSQVSK